MTFSLQLCLVDLEAATPVLHGGDGVLRLANLPLFPPNIMMVIMAKQFVFHQTRGHFSKRYDICPHVQVQTVFWLFIAVLEQWLLPC